MTKKGATRLVRGARCGVSRRGRTRERVLPRRLFLFVAPAWTRLFALLCPTSASVSYRRILQICRKKESVGMNSETWMVVAGVCVLALVGGTYAWLRLPLYRWSCRHCRKVVSVSRLRPKRCACGAGARGLFLRNLRKLEHVAERQPSLCLVLLQEPHHRGRVQLRAQFIRTRNRDSKNRNQGAHQRSMV